MSKGLSDIALKIAIEIIYVEAAFRYCTHSTSEIIHVKTIFSYCTCDAIKIIYVQTAFSCCTFSPMELLMTNSVHAVVKKDTCLIKHHMYFKCLIKYVCNIFFSHL